LFNGVITTLSRGRTVYSGWLQGLALYTSRFVGNDLLVYLIHLCLVIYSRSFMGYLTTYININSIQRIILTDILLYININLRTN
jgi:hypothetical protein